MEGGIEGQQAESDGNAVAVAPATASTPGEEETAEGQASAAQKLVEYVKSLPDFVKALGTLLTAIATILTAGEKLGMVNPSGPGPSPKVTISEPRFLTTTLNEEGDELLDTVFRIDAVNMSGQIVAVEGAMYDVVTQKQIPVTSRNPVGFAFNYAEDGGNGHIFLPKPAKRGCIFIRVVAFDKEHDEMASEDTPGFDPHNPENPSCPLAAIQTPPAA